MSYTEKQLRFLERYGNLNSLERFSMAQTGKPDSFSRVVDNASYRAQQENANAMMAEFKKVHGALLALDQAAVNKALVMCMKIRENRKKGRLTLKKVNAAILKEVGPGIELVRGRDYHYFSGEKRDITKDSMVMVCYLHQLTLEEWVREAKEHYATD